MTDDAALRALRALRELVNTGGWHPLPGAPDMLIFIRPWPDDSVDTLAVRDDTDAVAERTNPTGNPVWRHTGDLTTVIAQLRALPPPGAANAPRQAIPGDHDGWC